MAEPLDPAIDSDPRPVVRTASQGNLGLWIFLGLLLLGGAWVVSLMSTVREAAQAPVTTVPSGSGGGKISSSAPPPLPPRFTGVYPETGPRILAPVPGRQVPRFVPQTIVPTPPPVTRNTARESRPAPAYNSPADVDRETLPAYTPARATNLPTVEPNSQAQTSADRVRAGRLADPSRTVPLGTIIPAVLETALDSTRAGSVRALVQRDVRSFDGSRVLIPRGSRLYGGYEGELANGQNRALVTWTRLLRPDGVTIALDSQASDPLGRAGIKGKVDSKFWQRFGGAILQSVLDIGVGIATREATDGVIVALPGSTQNVTRISPQQVTPTLTVKHGTSVSVYVGRDLDFSSVE